MHALLQGGSEDPIAGSFGAETALAVDRALPVPVSPHDLAAHYDLTISHPGAALTTFAAFDRWLAQAAALRGLSCALIHDGEVEESIRRLDSGRLTIGYHLDYFALWHLPGDPYARLAQAIQDSGGRPVNHPARARLFTDKAAAHAELARRGLGTPATAVLRPGSPDEALTTAARMRLRLHEPGARVYVKPANGFGGRGVRTVDGSNGEALAAALRDVRQQEPHDALLIQRAVRCPSLRTDDGSERPAYWRVLCCLGVMIPLWWSPHEPGRPSYRRLTRSEVDRHRLGPMLAFVAELAELCRLDWFSTEVCLSDGPEPSAFTVCSADGRDRPVVAIDTFNDQCDVDVQSRWPGAPPDDVVRYLAVRFANAAWKEKRTTHPALRLAA